MRKISVGILGATGMVGQQYLRLLANHSWFDIGFLAASGQSAGKSYEEAVAGRWHMCGSIPERFRSMPVHRIDEVEQARKLCRIVFSAVGSDAAKVYEELYAELGMIVLSNASYHRQSADVPVLIPEVNPDHLRIIPIQRKNRGWDRGCIVTKPNCSLQSYMIPLDPLHRLFKVRQLHVTTLQVVSGAGYPGVPMLDILDNIVPYISDEEEKSEKEPLKIWGSIQEDGIHSATDPVIAAHCNRVPVLDGHLACVSVAFEQTPSEEDILREWGSFQGIPQQLRLPSAPAYPVIYRNESDRPQPRLDRDAGSGMSVTVGRLRKSSIFDYRFVALSHNTMRGAAGGGVLNAELLVKMGYLEEIW